MSDTTNFFDEVESNAGIHPCEKNWTNLEFMNPRLFKVMTKRVRESKYSMEFYDWCGAALRAKHEGHDISKESKCTYMKGYTPQKVDKVMYYSAEELFKNMPEVDYDPEKLFVSQLPHSKLVGKTSDTDLFLRRYREVQHHTYEQVCNNYLEAASKLFGEKLTEYISKFEELSKVVNTYLEAGVALGGFNENLVATHDSIQNLFPGRDGKYVVEYILDLYGEVYKLFRYASTSLASQYAFGLYLKVFDPQYVPSLIKRVLLPDQLWVIKQETMQLMPKTGSETVPALSRTNEVIRTTKSLSSKEQDWMVYLFKSMYEEPVMEFFNKHIENSETKEIFDKVRSLVPYLTDEVISKYVKGEKTVVDFYINTLYTLKIAVAAFYKPFLPFNGISYICARMSLPLVEISMETCIKLREIILRSEFFEDSIKLVMKTASRKSQLKEAAYANDSDLYDSLLNDRAYK